jgi:uncharacterized protein YjiS (DUF1127 family)
MQLGNQRFINTGNDNTGIGARKRRPGGAEAWRRAIGAAVASVMDGVTQGFALHAPTLHPQIFWSLLDHGAADSAQPEGHAQNRRLAPPQPRQAVTVSSFEPHESTRWISSRNSPVGNPGRWSARVSSLPGRLWSRMLDAFERQRATRALEALDDRTLKDMGISRYEIDYLVRHGRPWN